MADFSKEIQNFKRYGTYVYKFDQVGNLTFNSSSSDFSRVYLAFPIKNHVYNNAKIQSFYPPEFTEFIPQVLTIESNVENTNEQVDLLKEENNQLKSQLESLTNTANDNMSDAEKLASKQVIFELRKALGQGRVDSDFSNDFPYTPIRKQANIDSSTATEIASINENDIT